MRIVVEFIDTWGDVVIKTSSTSLAKAIDKANKKLLKLTHHTGWLNLRIALHKK